jgi:hypothetical protein
MFSPEKNTLVIAECKLPVYDSDSDLELLQLDSELKIISHSVLVSLQPTAYWPISESAAAVLASDYNPAGLHDTLQFIFSNEAREATAMQVLKQR